MIAGNRGRLKAKLRKTFTEAMIERTVTHRKNTTGTKRGGFRKTELLDGKAVIITVREASRNRGQSHLKGIGKRMK
jgi:hypothetical protein